VISLVKNGRDYSEEDQGIQEGGVTPRRVQVEGATPTRELPFSVDVKGGEIVTLK
jgi:hypothetical protein